MWGREEEAWEPEPPVLNHCPRWDTGSHKSLEKGESKGPWELTVQVEESGNAPQRRERRPRRGQPRRDTDVKS